MMNLSEARQLTEQLMDKHIIVNRHTWSFEYMHRSSLGVCHHSRFNDKNKILLNLEYVRITDVAEVKLTILHEIAHAIVGHNHGHDWLWQQTCLSIGGDGKRLSDSNTFKQVEAMHSKYVAICPTCRASYHINRMGRLAKAGRTHCGPCSRKHGFTDASRLNYRTNTRLGGY
jgi:predicted SprT family Zn-dependent metalloprotease